MGRVLSPECIENGRIPAEGAHKKAARYILERLAGLEQSCAGEVNCVIYGTTATGKANVRSDVDLFATVYQARYGQQKSQGEKALEQIIDDAEHEYKVAVEAHVIPEENVFIGGDDVELASYSLDPLYMRHIIDIMQRFPEWCHGRPPVGSYDQPSDDPFGEETAAIAWTVARFGSAKAHHAEASLERYHRHFEVNYHDLQRAFELPKSIARKALALAGDQHDVTDKQTMHAMVTKIAHKKGSSRLVGGQQALIELDNEYSQVLEQTIGGGMDLKAYSKWLKDHNLPALQYAEAVAVHWSDIFTEHAEAVALKTGLQEADIFTPQTLYD